MSSNFQKKNKKIQFPYTLKELRKIKEITLEDFANTININPGTFRHYEIDNTIPSLPTIIVISNYFGVSIDFLLFGNNTHYLKSIKLLDLSEKIEKMDQIKRFQIESTANSLISGQKLDFFIKVDNNELQLTDNFHKNLKEIRKKIGYSQKKIAELIGTSRSQIALYEMKSVPKPTNLFKLSEILNISIHALTTGIPLNPNFRDLHLKETMLKADSILSLKEKEFFCHLMQRIIEDVGQGNN